MAYPDEDLALIRARTPGPLAKAAIASGAISGNPTNALGALPDSKKPAAPCAVGTSSGNPTGLGAPNDNALGTGIDPRLSESFNCAKPQWEAANPGMKVYAFSGVSPRPSNPNSLHPQGKAMDVAIYGTDGVLLNNLYNDDAPAFAAYESFASAMGGCYQSTQGTDPAGTLKWGGNFGGTWYNDSMHFDVGGGSTSRGDIFQKTSNPSIPNNSNGNRGIVYDGPKDGASANAGTGSGATALGAPNDSALTSTGATNNAVCSNSNNPGCQPISAGVAGVASSLLGGAGLASPASMLGSLSSILGGAGGILQGALENAISSASGLANGVQALTTAGLPNNKTAISSTVTNAVKSMGSGILPSITGVIPSDFI